MVTLIKVPRPSKKAWNPDRPVNALLKVQMEHLHDAEKRLPFRFHTDFYINAIKTEGDAAEYIRAVTEAIHAAHEEAPARRARPVTKARGISIAAVADERSAGRRSSSVKKKSTRKSGRKKK